MPQATADFTAANGTFVHLLYPSVTTTADGDVYRVNSNSCYSDSSGEHAAIYNVGAGPLQESEIEIVAMDGGWQGAAILGTIAGGVFSGYGLYTNGSETEFFKSVGGSSTILASTSAVAWAPTDKLKVRHLGDGQFGLYRNGVLISAMGVDGVVEDETPLVTGQPGWATYGSSTGTRFDNWSGGDYASGPAILGAGDGAFRVGEVGVDITWTGGGETQGSGFVRICPSDDIEDVNGVNQTVTDWGADGGTINIVRGSLPLNQTLYLFMKNDAGQSNAAGFPITMLPSVIVMAAALLLLD